MSDSCIVMAYPYTAQHFTWGFLYLCVDITVGKKFFDILKNRGDRKCRNRAASEREIKKLQGLSSKLLVVVPLGLEPRTP